MEARSEKGQRQEYEKRKKEAAYLHVIFLLDIVHDIVSDQGDHVQKAIVVNVRSVAA